MLVGTAVANRGLVKPAPEAYTECMDVDAHLRRSADEILGAAWPKERRRAALRLEVSVLWRIALFVVMLLILGVAVHVMFGLTLPWTFYVFTTGLAFVCARPGADERTHLRGEADGSPQHLPSTGCYPGNGWAREEPAD